MKIVHLILSCFYKEGYGYQENILPYKHKQLGHDTCIVTRFAHDNIIPFAETHDKVIHYVNENQIDVYVLPTNNTFVCKIPFLSKILCHTKKLVEVLDNLSPDIVFCHGIYISDYRDLIRYLEKRKSIKLFVDNHADYYNTPIKKGFFSSAYRRFFQIPVLKRMEKRSEMFWGVTPWRVDFMREVYGIEETKSKLLVMGGDENKIDWVNRKTIRSKVREKYNILETDFVIVTGGKVDVSKNTHLLIEAVKDIEGVKLLLFGSIKENMEHIVGQSKNVCYIGWINSDAVYDIFLAADLGVFPGTHSVLWEQACSAGLPCVFKDWNGHMSHVDVGGNCVLLKDVSIDNLKRRIEEIIENKNIYNRMKTIAQTAGREKFSYISIAKESILI